MRSYCLALYFGLVCLSFTSLASAVSPGVVRAVADRPLVVTLEDDTVLEVEVVELGEDTVIVMDDDGNVTELDYDDITAVRVNSAAAAEETAAEEAVRDEEQSVRDRIEAAREREAARLEAARREADAQRETGPAGSRTGTWREEEPNQRERNIPRFYSRLGIQMGLGRGHYLGEQTSSFAVGFGLAGGARVSESIAVHANFSFAEMLQDGEYSSSMLHLTAGFTVFSGKFLFSMSLGGGALTNAYVDALFSDFTGVGATAWGLGGDFLFGGQKDYDVGVSIGGGLGLRWLFVGEDDEGNEGFGALNVGPQFFISY